MAGHSFLLSLPLMVHLGLSSQLVARQSCSADYELCSPPGAIAGNIPAVGPALSGMYINLLDAVDPPSPPPTPPEVTMSSPAKMARQDSNIMCCASGTTCLLMQQYNAPLCYDRFTTDFYLSDGSFGTIYNGSYLAASGAHVDLITGNYIYPNGETGNIYRGSAQGAPNTYTLLIPTPWTSKGVGSAIPASQLGGQATYPVTTPSNGVSPDTTILLSVGPTPTSDCSCDQPLTNITTAAYATATYGPLKTPPSVTSVNSSFPSLNASSTPPFKSSACRFCEKLRLPRLVGMHASVAILALMVLG